MEKTLIVPVGSCDFETLHKNVGLVIPFYGKDVFVRESYLLDAHGSEWVFHIEER